MHIKSGNRPSVLQIVDSLGMGGAETWLMEVLRLWSKTEGIRMDFLITSGQKSIFDDEAKNLGANLFYLRYSRKSLPQFIKSFREVLREREYIAIHDHQDYVSGWHLLFGNGLLPPIRVIHVHNPSYQIYNNYGNTLSRRLTAQAGKALISRFATHITGTSRQLIREYGFDKAFYSAIPKAALHCGFDPNRFAGNCETARDALTREFDWPQDSLIILYAGRIDQSPNPTHPRTHKNSGFAVDVAISACRRNERIRMLLAGKPSSAVPLLQQRIAEAGFAGRIVFAGIRCDVDRLMSAANLLLFPSRGEGLGMVAVEAQAAGLPVLASTAVPREAVVVQDLIQFLNINEGSERWAQVLLELIVKPKDVAHANQIVSSSAFSIANSAEALAKLYVSGALN